MNAFIFDDIVVNCELCKKEIRLPANTAYIQVGNSCVNFSCICPDCVKKLTDGINDLIDSLAKEKFHEKRTLEGYYN